MGQYTSEEKEGAIKKMLAPKAISVSKLSSETEIPAATLYNWKKIAIENTEKMPKNTKQSRSWSSEDKFKVVLETATMNEAEIAEYCRKKVSVHFETSFHPPQFL